MYVLEKTYLNMDASIILAGIFLLFSQSKINSKIIDIIYFYIFLLFALFYVSFSWFELKDEKRSLAMKKSLWNL